MLWVKAFHIIAVICWFAGLFYLPRLFVYHAMAEQEGDKVGVARFKIMERKLYRAIMTPSAVVALVLGVWMLVDRWTYFSLAMWMYLKIGLVMTLFTYHHMCGKILQNFARDQNRRSHRFYRFFNEIPVLILVAVVLLVTLKQPY